MRSLRTANQNAFTLIELLVVIAIIGMLLAVLIPALQYAKVQATAAVCLANVRGVSLGYMLYSEDNDAWLMDGDTGDVTSGWATYANRRVHLFVADPQSEAGARRSDTMEDKIRGFQRGALWPYAESPKLYHCPSDKRYLGPPRVDAPISGARMGGYRSYSLGGVLSAWFLERSMNPTSDTGEQLCVAVKMNEFISTSQKITWLEEADGYA